ncbi:hypothetical protein HPB50_018736 [Hyalomma asiaticum]|uniref:Uncharacterized protein n=1 Tax=Hyalomma asiaticum TaxID=266040 RepID=A0ACB7RUT8_HYAAI|nr:hypothetical protein HPB50_018736 [Hyalomma asiaticum]
MGSFPVRAVIYADDDALYVQGPTLQCSRKCFSRVYTTELGATASSSVQQVRVSNLFVACRVYTTATVQRLYGRDLRARSATIIHTVCDWLKPRSSSEVRKSSSRQMPGAAAVRGGCTSKSVACLSWMATPPPPPVAQDAPDRNPAVTFVFPDSRR